MSNNSSDPLATILTFMLIGAFIIFSIFLHLKLSDTIQWSWWYITMPLYGIVLFPFMSFIFALPYYVTLREMYYISFAKIGYNKYDFENRFEGFTFFISGIIGITITILYILFFSGVWRWGTYVAFIMIILGGFFQLLLPRIRKRIVRKYINDISDNNY